MRLSTIAKSTRLLEFMSNIKRWMDKDMPDEYATQAERNQIVIDAVAVHLGETSYKLTCPRCKQSGSFAVTREADTLLYYCHRAQCGIRGRVFSTLYDTSKKGNVYPITGNTSVPVIEAPFGANPFLDPIVALPKEVEKYLANRFQLHKVDIEANNIQFDEVNGRLVIPIYDYYSRRTGFCLKTIPSSVWGGRKVVNYWEIDDEIRLHFPPKLVQDDSTVVVVEGILDAIKVSPIFASAAMLGSNLSQKQARFLAAHFKKLIVAMDPDAIQKARDILSRYRAMFDTLTIKYLEKDPKDTDFDKLENILTG